MIRVLIAGEGPNEIGAGTIGTHDGAGTGVVEELLAKVRVGGYEIRSKVQWREIHKLKLGVSSGGDEHAVRVLAMRATELGCNALVFVRDRDRDVSRERTIQRAALAEQQRRRNLRVAWGVPIEMLESWLLALQGETRSEQDVEPVLSLENRHGVPAKKTSAMVQLVRKTKLLNAPEDASSFWRWLRLVAPALNVRTPKEWR